MRELWGSPDIWNAKKTYLQIANRLGVDEETVRNRVKRLKDTGFLLGWRVIPNPALLGLTFSLVLLELEDPSSKEQSISRLTKSDGMINIASTFGNSLMLTALEDQQHSFSKQISEMRLGKASELPGLGLRPTSLRMTGLDWEIVRLVLRDAEKKMDEIAIGLKVSARTVKRRLNNMMRDSAILIMPMVNLRNTEGISYQ